MGAGWSRRWTVAVLVGLQGVGLLLGYVVQVYLAHRLGKAQYGLYRHAFSWLMVASALACLGFPTALQRYLPEYRARQQRALEKGLVRFVSVATVALGVVLGACISAVVCVVGGSEDSVWVAGREYFHYAWVVVPTIAFFLVTVHISRAVGRYLIAFGPYHLGRPVAHAIGGMLVNAGVSRSLMLPGVAGVLALLSGGQRLLLAHLGTWSEGGVRARYAPGAWLKTAIPIVLMNLANIVNAQAGILAAGFVLRASDVGLVAVALQLGMVPSMITAAIESVIAPQFAMLYFSGDKKALVNLVRRSARGGALGTIGVAGVICGATPWLLRLYGPEFCEPESATLVRLLLVPPVVYGIAGFAGVYLNVTGREKRNAVLFGVTTGVTLLAAVGGGRKWGLVGLGTGYVAGRVLGYVAAAVLVWMSDRVNTSVAGADSARWAEEE